MSEVELSQPEVRWLTEPEMKAWYSLVRSTTGLLAVLDNELQAEHGLTFGDYEVLVHLSAAPDHAIRMSDLAGRLRLSPSGITRRLDGLVKVGLVERRPCPNDRRGSNAVLTELGMERLQRGRAHACARCARALHRPFGPASPRRSRRRARRHRHRRRSRGRRLRQRIVRRSVRVRARHELGRRRSSAIDGKACRLLSKSMRGSAMCRRIAQT